MTHASFLLRRNGYLTVEKLRPHRARRAEAERCRAVRQKTDLRMVTPTQGSATRHSEHFGSRRWSFRCERCDHSYRTFAQTYTAAASAARANGWIVEPGPLCPGCASVAVSLGSAVALAA